MRTQRCSPLSAAVAAALLMVGLSATSARAAVDGRDFSATGALSKIFRPLKSLAPGDVTVPAASASSKHHPHHHHHHSSHDLGEPLDLTPYAKSGDWQRAQQASKVELGNLTSYTGFVETTPGRHMFFWYFPAQSGDENAPLLIWLQGGPGGSSNFGLFSENGPFSLSEDLELVPRPHTWNKDYGMIFIDNPVGAGFSYPDSDDLYCNNTRVCVASNLYSLMQNFYTLFPDQQRVKLFCTGESYGGHYVPAFAAWIHDQNGRLERGEPLREPDAVGSARAPIKIPLAGIAVGDGWIDPVNMIPAYPGLLYNVGMADERQRDVIQNYCDRTVELIRNGQMVEAFEVWDEMLNGDLYPYPNYFHNISGSNDYDNFLRTNAPAEFSRFAPYLNQPHIRAAMHTGNATFNDGSKCEKHLVADFHVSFAQELITLLEAKEDYNIVVYSGQLDIIIGAPLTEAFLSKLPWSGLEEYQNAERSIWMLPDMEDPVAGYVRSVGKFTQVIIRGAGHIAPYDQPERALDMINRFLVGESA